MIGWIYYRDDNNKRRILLLSSSSFFSSFLSVDQKTDTGNNKVSKNESKVKKKKDDARVHTTRYTAVYHNRNTHFSIDPLA